MDASHLYDIELVRGRALATVVPRITASAGLNGFYPQSMLMHGNACASSALATDAMLAVADSLTLWVVAYARGTRELCGFATGSKGERARFQLGHLYVAPGHNKTIVEKFLLLKVRQEMTRMQCSELRYECELDMDTIRRMFAHEFRLRMPPLISLEEKEEDESLPSVDQMVWAMERLMQISPKFRNVNQNTARLGQILEREQKAAALATDFLSSADEPDLREFARLYDRYMTRPNPRDGFPAFLCLCIPQETMC